uniref:Uncharacterized protein n=1 Tax=Sus scrofa TaxID=9823 RepID=A0A8D1JPG2_PIG
MSSYRETWGKPPAGGLPFLSSGPHHQRMAEYIQSVATTILLTEGNRKLTFGERLTVRIKTGYGDTNAWLKWIKYSADTLHKGSCYTCATGRLEAQVIPFPLGRSSDPQGLECVMAFFQDKTA